MAACGPSCWGRWRREVVLGPGPGGAAPASSWGRRPRWTGCALLPGGAGSGGCRAFWPGHPTAPIPTRWSRSTALSRPWRWSVGAVYRSSTSCRRRGTAADGDFYMFRAKPGHCYLVLTGPPGARAGHDLCAPRRPARAAGCSRRTTTAAHTARIAEARRGCSATDTLVVAEVHNDGWAPSTDPRARRTAWRRQTSTRPPRPQRQRREKGPPAQRARPRPGRGPRAGYGARAGARPARALAAPGAPPPTPRA